MDIKKEIKKKLSENESLKKKINAIHEIKHFYSSKSNLAAILYDLTEETENSPIFKKFIGLFYEIMTSIIYEFHTHDIYPSIEYTTEIIFNHLHEISPEEIILNIVEDIHFYGLTKTSLIVYPVNSFGLQDVGLINIFGKIETRYETEDCIIFPQQNNIDKAIKCIEVAKEKFKLKSYKLDYTLINHFLNTRPLSWFHKNPLLIVKSNITTNYYDNDLFLIRILEKNIKKLFISYCLITSKNLIQPVKGFSTRVLNNFETNDIYHYLIFTNIKSKLLQPSCIPIQKRKYNIFELTSLNIDLPLSLDNNLKSEYSVISKFIDTIYKESLGKPKGNKDYYWDLFERFRRSLGYFIRSYQSKHDEDAILFLSIAFELIYGDRVIDNIKNVLSRNIVFLFEDDRDNIYKIISNLYNARSGVAHEGVARECNLLDSRNLYLKSMLEVIKLIENNKLNLSSKTPFTDYTKSIANELLGYSSAFI